MTSVQSQTFHVAAVPGDLLGFLANPSNLIHVLPADRIEDWESDEAQCSFRIKGLTNITLRRSDQNDSSIRYETGEDEPIPFTLDISVNDSGSGSDLSAEFNADVNSFLGSMIKGPMESLLNYIGEAVQNRYGEN